MNAKGKKMQEHERKANKKRKIIKERIRKEQQKNERKTKEHERKLPIQFNNPQQ